MGSDGKLGSGNPLKSLGSHTTRLMVLLVKGVEVNQEPGAGEPRPHHRGGDSRERTGKRQENLELRHFLRH